MTTSRQPLNLPGEVTWRVPSLRGPKANEVSTVESLAQYDAVQLFVDRAVRARPNFAVTNENVGARRADLRTARRHPARHRAGGRTRPQRVGGAHRRGPRRPVPAAARRQHHAAARASRRCTSRSSGATSSSTSGSRRCSAASPCSAAGSVSTRPRPCAPSSRSTPYDVLDLLGGLVDRSLVVLDDEGPADRYRLLETIKQFARARLEEAGEVTHVLDRHLAHFAELVGRARARPRDRRAARRAAPSSNARRENLRVALVHAATLDDPVVARRRSRGVSCSSGSRPRSSTRATTGSRRRSSGSATRPRRRGRSGPACSGDGAILNFYFGDFGFADGATSTRGVAAAEACGRSAGDRPRARSQRRPRPARPRRSRRSRRCEAALELSRAVGDGGATIDILQKIGFSYLYADRYRETRPWLDEAVARGLGDDNPFFVAWHHNGDRVRRASTRRRPRRSRDADARATRPSEECGDLTHARPGRSRSASRI